MIKYQGKDSQENRETRFLEEELQMDNSILRYDDKEIFFSDSEGKCCHGKFYCMAPPNYKCGRSVKDVGKFTKGDVNNRVQRARLGLCGQRPKGSRSTKWKVSSCPLAQSANFAANKEDPVLQKPSIPLHQIQKQKRLT